MFRPPRCPYRSCPRHVRPNGRFFHRHGSYAALCRAHRVPRFRCRTCGRTFSRQTFRVDYRDHRPDRNAGLFSLLASGVGLRQSARLLGLSRSSTDLKARKIGRHLRRLNLNLRGPLPGAPAFQLDELETYEGRRNTRPLSVPVLIHKESRFLVWAEAATIRPSGRMNAARRRAIEAEERVWGPRKDLSVRALERTLRRALPLVEGHGEVFVGTDEKSNYPGLLRRTFGRRKLVHERTNSKLARTTWNPLFPINHTEAIARDLTGRLRRESWLVSKRRRWLDVALHVFMAYRNYVRRRFNHDPRSPAQCLGFAPRRLTPHELLSWRQEAGRASIHPLARRSESVESFLARLRKAA